VATDLKPGDRIRIERDERLHPPAGTWHRYRHKPGVVVILSQVADEVGVEVGAVQARYDADHRLVYDHAKVSWFRPYELRRA